MSEKRANESVFQDRSAASQGGLGACPQQAKKGRSPPAPQGFFWDIGTNIHACVY